MSEGKAESGEALAVIRELVAMTAQPSDKWHDELAWSQRWDRMILNAHAVLAAAQPPAPADDAASVLAGLLSRIVKEIDSNYGDPIALDDKMDGLYEARRELRSRGLYSGLKPLPAAQQRLADRGQGGGSDG